MSKFLPTALLLLLLLSPSLLSLANAAQIDGSFSASGSLNINWLGAMMGYIQPSTPPPPLVPITTPPPPPTPSTSATPVMMAIPPQFEGQPCMCKMMAELMGKMNLLMDKQFAFINGTDPISASIDVRALLTKPVVISNTTVVVKDLQPDPTLLDKLAAKIKMCIPPKLKEILGAIKVDDLMALIALLKNGSIKTLKDLVQAIKEKFPELYALLKAIYVKVKIVIEELKLKIGDKAMAFLKEIGTLLVDDAKEVYKFVGDSFKSNPQMAPNMLNAFLGLFGGISVTMNGKEYSASVTATAAVVRNKREASPSVANAGQLNCPKPSKTAVLIYNKSDPKIKTQVQPAAECQCPNDPTNSMVFFNPVAQDPTTGVNAGASPINQQCSKMEDFCICDESDVCWKLQNAYAQVVINSFCDPECHMYARMNNISPFTQTLVSTSGKTIKLSDELKTISADGKRHAYKPMMSSADYYVKAKSISCTGSGKPCTPIKCTPAPVTTPAPMTVPAPVTTPAPVTVPAPAPVPATVAPPTVLSPLVIDIQLSISLSGNLMVMTLADLLKGTGIFSLLVKLGVPLDGCCMLNIPLGDLASLTANILVALGIGPLPPFLTLGDQPMPMPLLSTPPPSMALPSALTMPPVPITLPPPPPASSPAAPMADPGFIASIMNLFSLIANSSISVSISVIFKDMYSQLAAMDDPMKKLPVVVDENLQCGCQDVDANLVALAKKVEAEMPQTPLEMLSKVKVSDLQGLQAVISIVIQGSVNLSKPEDLANLVKQKAPGISDSIVSVLAKASNYMKQFGDPATQKFGQTVYQLNVSLKASLKAQLDANQPGLQKIVDVLKQLYPSFAPVLDGKVDPLCALFKLLTNGMKELSDKAKYQLALDGMKVDPNSLSDLAVAVKGSLSVDIRAVLAMIQPKDIDGLKLVLNMSAQITSIGDLIKALTTNCPGLVDALRLLMMKLTMFVEFLFNFYFNMIDDSARSLIKMIVQVIIDFFKNVVPKAAKELQLSAPGMLQKMLDDLMNCVPSLKPLLIGLKFSLSITIDVQVGDNIIQVNGSTPTTPTTSTTAQLCAAGGTWGAWTDSGTCSKSCGLCGTVMQARKCMTEASGCPCSGPSTQEIKCNPQPCVFPEQSCCGAAKAKNNNGKIECV